MKKRGMVSPVFKYIMALIVGTMFLSFFINWGLSYMKGQTSLEAYRLTSGFDDVLSALGSSEDSDNTYDFGVKTIISFKPGKEGKNNFELRSGQNKPIKTYKLIFSPKTLAGSSLVILTKRWYFPFAVDNFFYLTNKNYKYFLIFDDETEEWVTELAGPEDEVTAEIPNKLGVEIIKDKKLSQNLQTLKNSIKNFQTTFILFGQNIEIENALKKIPNTKIRIIKPNNEDRNYGEIKFEDENEIPYFGQAMMIGSIFAEDSKSYDYALGMALNKLGIISNIYSEKLKMIGNKPAFFSCTEYSLIKENFDSLAAMARNNEKDADKYKILVEALNDNNEFLGGDCPEIF